MKEDFVAMAHKAGFNRVVSVHPVTGIRTVEAYAYDSIERFFKAAYAAGAKAERNECVRICCEHWLNGGNAMECADAIRERDKK